MRIIVLVDHKSSHPGVRTEWGASIYIQWQGRAVLFDMGASGLFADNAHALGLPLDQVWFAVLSHAHLDHGGGLARFFAENAFAPVWACSGITADLFLDLAILKKRIGLDPRVIARHRERFLLVDQDSQVVPGVRVVTGIPQSYPSPRGNRLLLRRDGQRLVHDDFRHELALVIDDGDGLVAFAGCSHHGVLNMVEAVRQALPEQPIKALVGGFHFVGIPVIGLFGDRLAAIRDVADRLNALGVPRIFTMHCTGQRGYTVLRETMGPRVEYIGAGASVDL